MADISSHGATAVTNADILAWIRASDDDMDGVVASIHMLDLADARSAVTRLMGILRVLTFAQDRHLSAADAAMAQLPASTSADQRLEALVQAIGKVPTGTAGLERILWELDHPPRSSPSFRTDLEP